MEFETRPLSGAIGAEVIGLDLDRDIDEATEAALNDVWLDAAIVLFRGVGTSNDRHLRLSRAFGELEVHPVETIRLEGAPEIIRLAQKAGDTESMTYTFDGEPIVGRIPYHTDLIYTTTPNRGAILRMVEKPSHGGQTGWIDTAAAYDALDDETKARIEGLELSLDLPITAHAQRGLTGDAAQSPTTRTSSGHQELDCCLPPSHEGRLSPGLVLRCAFYR